MMTKGEYMEHIKTLPSYNDARYKIYTLTNPMNDEIFYIGCTKSTLHQRLCSHILGFGFCGLKRKTEIIRDIVSNGYVPIINPCYWIESKEEAQLIEKHLINFVGKNIKSVFLANTLHKKQELNGY